MLAGALLPLVVGAVPSAGGVSDREPVALARAETSGLDGRLREIARASTPSRLESEARRLRLATRGLFVAVDVFGPGGAAAVRAAGGSIRERYEHRVQAFVPAERLEMVASAPGVRGVTSAATPVPLGVVSEGVALTNAPALHGAGVTGAGVKVAVVDVGFKGYTGLLGTELPASVQTADFCGGGLDGPDADPHGTAVAEVIHDMAPGASLLFACVDTVAGLEDAAAWAEAQGARIINSSLGWFGLSRGDGTGGEGTPDAVVRDAREAGLLWVNGAGNFVDTAWSSVYADANEDGLDDNLGEPHRGPTFRVPAGATICAFMRWDAWPLTSQDLDFALVDQGELAAVLGERPSGRPAPAGRIGVRDQRQARRARVLGRGGRLLGLAPCALRPRCRRSKTHRGERLARG